MPPKTLTASLMTNIIAGEELAQDAAVGETADAIATLGELGHLDSSVPDTQVAIADVHPRSRGQGGARWWNRWRPPSAHSPPAEPVT